MLCNLKPYSFYRRKRDVQPLRQPAIISNYDTDEESNSQSPRKKASHRSPLRSNSRASPVLMLSSPLAPLSSPAPSLSIQQSVINSTTEVFSTPIKRKLEWSDENDEISDRYIPRTDSSGTGELEVPVLFASRKECADILCKKYGVDQQRTLTIHRPSHGSRNEVFLCEGCKDFRMHISKKTRKNNSGWSLSARTSNLHHRTTEIEGGHEVKYRCKGTYRAKLSDIKNMPQLQALVGTTKTLKGFTTVAKTLGVEISTDVAKKALSGKVLSGQAILSSAAFIEPYLDELKELNPGCEVKLERFPGTDDFHRLLVIPAYTADVVNKGYAYPVIGIDGAHMKDVQIKKRIPRVLLEKMHVTVISSRMPGNTTIILAFMLSHSECEADITELLRVMKEKGVDLNREDLVIISDRGNAIHAAVTNQLTKAYQHYCPIHIERNLKHHGYTKLLKWFWMARNAATKAEYDNIMSVLRSKGSVGERMHAYLLTIGDHWQLYLVLEKGLTLYGMKSNNIIESVMSWILEERARSPYYFVKSMMHLLHDELQRQKDQALVITDVLTEYADKTYTENKHIQDCYSFEATPASDSTYHVINTVEDSITAPDYRVDWSTHKCSCLQWQQSGVPCSHAVAVAEHLSVVATVFFAPPYFDKRMLQSTRREAFSTCNFDNKLPTHDEVLNRKATQNYSPLTYRLRTGHILPISTARYASQGESLHSGNRNPRRNIVRRCRLCYQPIKSPRNHSIFKCRKTVARLRERGQYNGPLPE